MFQGQFSVKQEGGEYVGRLTLQTPKGPLNFRWVSPDAKEIRDKLDSVAAYFDGDELVGANIVDFADDVWENLNGSDPAARAIAAKKLSAIRRSGERGSLMAQDVCYMVRRNASRESAKRRMARAPKFMRLPSGTAMKGNLDNMGGLEAQAARKVWAMLNDPATKATGVKMYMALKRDDSPEADAVCELIRQYARAELLSRVPMMGFSFSGLVKSASKLAKKAAPFAALVPGIGPSIEAGLNLVSSAKELMPEAVEKLQTIDTLAKAGVPAAKKAKAVVKVAAKMQSKAESALLAKATGKKKKKRVAARGPSVGPMGPGDVTNVFVLAVTPQQATRIATRAARSGARVMAPRQRS